MKVVMIVGSIPPGVCGVGDYTSCLATKLQAYGVTTEIVTKAKKPEPPHLLRRITELQPDVVHFQYPSFGFHGRSSFTPQMLNLLYPGVVTLHEVSRAPIHRKLSLFPFLYCAKHIIFTSHFEHNYTEKWFRWTSKYSSIIPISSNIPAGRESGVRNFEEIVYFGLVHPNKGLEDILELALLIKKNLIRLSIRIVGTFNPRYLKYLEEIQAKARNLPIIWNLGLASAAVADLLSQSSIAYVPFPDGASERRGSLLGLLKNGVATITTQGPHTPPELEGVVEFAPNPEKALKIIQTITTDRKSWMKLSHSGQIYAERFSWDTIAIQHVKIYEKIISVQSNAAL